MKDLRLARQGKRRRRAKPVENVLREGLRLERVPDPCVARPVRRDRRPRPPQGHPGALPAVADEPAAARVRPAGHRPPAVRRRRRSGPRSRRRSRSTAGSCRSTRPPGARSPSGSRTSTSTSTMRRASTASRRALDDDRRGARDARQPPLLPRHPAVAVRRDRRPSSGGSGSTTSATTAAGGGSSSRSRSGTTSTRRSGSTARSARSSASRRSTASTTTWARRRSATCWSSASATASSSRSGTAATSTTCRSRWPSRSASRTAARSTRRPARRATSSRTTCCSWSAWSRWSRRRRSRPTPCATRRSRSCARSRATRSTPRRDVVRGQYGPGWVAATQVPGYREEPEVDPGVGDRDVRRRPARRSTTGAGPACPFYVRTGKRLPKRATEIAIQYREVPHRLFKDEGVEPDAEPARDPDPARRGDHAALRRQGARASGSTSGR